MKKVLTLLAVLTAVGFANATVRVFVTSSASGYGLENNANHTIPTVSTVDDAGNNSNTYDYYTPSGGAGPLRVGVYPPSASPSGTVGDPILVAPGDFAYVWLQFQDEPGAIGINGLSVQISNGTPPDEFNAEPWVSPTWYLCNNKNTLGSKRWDGTATPPGYPEWTNNPQTFVSVTAFGIQNLLGANASQMWGGNANGRIALLGAIDASMFENGWPVYGTTLYLDITNINYTNDTTPTVSGGVFMFTPEPTSLLLLGLAGLLIRRR